MKPRAGFSLIELLVAMALLAVVLLLLFRGFTAVTETVSAGQRATAVQRTLENARRVMEEDLSMLVLHPRWPIFVLAQSDPDPKGTGEDVLVLAFLRHRPRAEGNTETEWVQYWRELRPDTPEAGVTRWVRYAITADAVDRQEVDGDEWWETKGRPDHGGEIVLDALLTAEFVVRLESGKIMEVGETKDRPATVDVLLAASVDPLPPAAPNSGSWLQRVRKRDGGWIQFRVRPTFDPGPVGDL